MKKYSALFTLAILFLFQSVGFSQTKLVEEVEQKEGKIVIFQNDKSGKLAADAPENYAEAVRPHIDEDEVITEKDYEDIEKLINAHLIFWKRMLRV